MALREPAAWAFKPSGHQVIEAAAYRELIRRERVAGTSGTGVLAYLIRHGVLARPPCFDAAPDSSTCDAKARHDRPIDFWPIVASGSPDLLESRQLGRRGQCFHFMADSKDWRKSKPDPDSGATAAMTHESYDRCVRLITSLFDENIHDPYAATVHGRGAYILLHTIADSFSSAHTEREEDGTGPIRFLKVWVLRTWLTYPIDAFHVKRRFHHSISDSRDKEYIDEDRVVDGKRCRDVDAAYEMPEGCLTPSAVAARDAIVDLLVTMVVAMRSGRPGADGSGEKSEGSALPLDLDREAKAAPAPDVSIDDPKVRREWQGFLERHMASAYAPLVVEKQHESEREWQPNLMVAATFRSDFEADDWRAGITLGGMQVVRRALPLLPLETLTLGYGRTDGHGRFFVRADMSFLIPIWDRVGIGGAPIAAGLDCATDFSDCHGDLLSMVARLSIVSDLGVWIDVSGPEYSWVDREWIERVGVSAGVAFDFLALLPFRSRPRVVDRSPSRWDPPELRGPLIRRSPITPAFFLAGDLASKTDDHLVAAGLEFRRERDRHNRRAGFGLVAELSYEHGRIGGDGFDNGRLIPFVSYYLIPNALALRLSPLAFGLGRRADETYGDIGAAAQAALSIGALEIGLAAPRLSYVHRADNHASPISLRFTWRL